MPDGRKSGKNGAGAAADAPAGPSAQARRQEAANLRRILKEESRVGPERLKALRAVRKDWDAARPKLLEALKGVDEKELRADVERLIGLDDEDEQTRLGKELAKKYRGTLGKIPRTAVNLPELALAQPRAGGTGPCPISSADAFRLLFCGTIPRFCPCDRERRANPAIFTSGSFTGFQGRADPATGSLYVRDRSALLAAPHTAAVLQGSFTVPGARPRVAVHLPVDITHATVTLAGISYSHGWVTLRLRVVDAVGTPRDVIRCQVELINHWTWWAGFGDVHHHRPPSNAVELVGCFDRAPTATPQSYLFSVELTADGTVFGFGGVQVSASARARDMMILACP